MLGAEALWGAAPGGGEVRDWEVWAAAPVTPSSRTVNNARAKSRKRSIIGCPRRQFPSLSSLKADGVENKANVPFRPLGSAGGFTNPAFELSLDFMAALGDSTLWLNR